MNLTDHTININVDTININIDTKISQHTKINNKNLRTHENNTPSNK